MKKNVLVVVLLLMLSSLAHAGDVKIRFGILPVLDTLPLQVAVNDGLFKEHGLDVELIRFSSALERDMAMQAGELDGYFGDIVATCMLINKNVPMYIALTSWRTTPGFPLFGIAKSPARSEWKLPELQGAKLGLSKSTIMEYLADRINEKKGVPLDYFSQIEIKKLPIRLQMLMTDQIDMAILPEPLLSLAKLKGGGIFATAEDLDRPLTVLCLHRKYFNDGAEPYVNFVTAYKEAVTRLARHPEEYRQLMAQTCRIPQPLIDKFPIYPYPMPTLPTSAELDDVQAWMKERGLLQEMIPHELILSPIIP
ncbi:ABC transporter substrate-binding protein [Pseudodesulfovibrio piezophilus]|uniref:NLPA lipoprotein n=1 Tax=Pseudodesulfovibrio piezophilus (strain DSM 21447 / JCM 15486 / C1TLV30) TaxID=1322246 RepID=M1WR37_PSEP2|nr:ABC transporter substrate-binding protein [Pseudodesulfovibrio piezophilus]CCH48087.1 NLPA lipoprotein [Pseudodesulfovibrio piezophilus C1TLV30]